MINKKDNPVEWALLIYGLEEAEEHLHNLIERMCEEDDFDEIDFKIQLGHIYSHLNLEWNSRNLSQEDKLKEGNYDKNIKFPSNIDPV